MSMHFTEDHEWVRVEGDTATIGISQYAAEQLGDVVFVELPDIGKVVAVSPATRCGLRLDCRSMVMISMRPPRRWKPG